MPELLSDAEITEALTTLPEWERRDGALFRAVKAPDFMAGIGLVDTVAVIAEELDHHPDIDIRWTTISFRLSTHVAHGITAYDVELAARIDAVVAEGSGFTPAG